MPPDFKVIAAGVNITRQIKDRLLSLTVSDEAGFKSDTIEITLDDRNNAIELPPLGAPLIIYMGYTEIFLALIGTFTADDLEPKVAEAFKPFLYEHLDQTDESDINLLTRIAKDHDAIASVKGGALVFVGKGEGKTASGTPMPPRQITKNGKLSWSMTLASRGNFKTVEAHWHNEEIGQKETVIAGTGAPIKRLRHVHATKAEAEGAAKAKLDELTRGDDTLSITMPGDPLIAAEGQIIALGFRTGVSGIWSVTSATHKISGGGFSTSIKTEKPKA